MNRSSKWLAILCGTVLVAGLALSIMKPALSTSTSTDDRSLIVTLSPLQPVVPPGSNSDTFATSTARPQTLSDLLTELPDLKSYLDKIKGLSAEKIDLAELYVNIVALYKAKGPAAVGVFLSDSGLLAALHVPPGYLDLLTVYDQTGIDGLLGAARARKIINDHDELSGFMAIDAAANLDTVTAALQTLGLSTYEFSDNTNELGIGLPIDTLLQFESPSALVNYVLTIAHTPHIVGFRLATPLLTPTPESSMMP